LVEVRVLLAVRVAVAVSVMLGVQVLEGVGVKDGVLVTEGVRVFEGVRVSEGVSVMDGVKETVLVGVGMGVEVASESGKSWLEGMTCLGCEALDQESFTEAPPQCSA
jgi:hypothetical protein